MVQLSREAFRHDFNHVVSLEAIPYRNIGACCSETGILYSDFDGLCLLMLTICDSHQVHCDRNLIFTMRTICDGLCHHLYAHEF